MTNQRSKELSNELPEYEPQGFFIDSPGVFSAKLTNEELARNLFRPGMVRIDCTCKLCDRDSIFHNLASSFGRSADVHFFHLHGDHIISFVCQRCHVQSISFAVHLTSDAGMMSMGLKHFKTGTLRKYGQSLSHADMHRDELKKYSKVISGLDYAEISRARGLASVGVNVGAFLYLRRVFERLIQETHASSPDIENRASFQSLPMDAKINALREYLPQFLIDNKRIYSILSKGIHELTEDECGRFYIVLHESILMIMDEALTRKERERKMKGLTAAISSIEIESGSK